MTMYCRDFAIDSVDTLHHVVELRLYGRMGGLHCSIMEEHTGSGARFLQVSSLHLSAAQVFNRVNDITVQARTDGTVQFACMVVVFLILVAHARYTTLLRVLV